MWGKIPPQEIIMNTINVNTINTLDGMRNAAETFRLAHEAANTRVGEMEFLAMDYKRAHGVAMTLVTNMKARIAELEDMLAPASAIGAPVPAVAPLIPMQAPAADVPVDVAPPAEPAPSEA